MKKINIQNWKEFKIEDLFELVKLNKLNSEDSRKFRTLEETDRNKVPAIVAKKGNNGVMYYVAKEDYETTSNKLVIIGDGAVASGLVYYHENEFTILHNAYAIDIKEKGEYSRYTFLFLKTIIQTMIYNQYGYEEKPTWNKVKLNRIYLPVDISGEPDWKYMESYIKQLYTRERESSYHVTTYVEKSKFHEIDIKNWKEFTLPELSLEIIKPNVFHTREIKESSEMDVAYIVRSKFNNGIKCYVEKNNNIEINPSGVITFGAENATFFYQKQSFISGRDIYYIDTRSLNEKTCLFLVSCLQKITDKYTYNNGLFPKDLIKEKIKLPVKIDNSPDWQYMEDYMKKLETSMKNMIKANNNFINVS